MNGSVVTMSVAPLIINGRTVVPLRFISEALGASVEWIGATKSIKIYYPVNPNIG
ncbi:MAG: copper amine oxidase N-terminal domain-containing protein [Caldisericia bacterium]